MPAVVLVTGAGRRLGAALAGALAADPGVGRVLAVDAAPPGPSEERLLGGSEFLRADLRNPLIGRVLAQAAVDTVVHLPLLGPAGAVAASAARQRAVLGTLQLLAGCQGSDTVRRLVVRSTTAVYGSSPHDPAIFTEDMHAAGAASSGYAREATEIEGHVRGFARRRPDVAVCLLRFASQIGPGSDTPLARYLAMPAVPTPLGFDPRLQLLHDADALEVLRRAVEGDQRGVVNVAGDGVVLLSQAVRRAGRVRVPLPAPALSVVGTLLRNAGALDATAEHSSFLNFGRVVDTARLRGRFGWGPAWTTEDALADYLRGTVDDRPAGQRSTGRLTAVLSRGLRGLGA